VRIEIGHGVEIDNHSSLPGLTRATHPLPKNIE